MVCTIVWSVLIDDPRRRWLAVYTLSVTAMVALNTLSAGLIVAHVVAAVVCTQPGQRLAAWMRTTVAAVLGLLLVAPLALISVQNGTGPLRVYPDVTVDHAFDVFVQLFTARDHPILGAGSVILLAIIGLLRVNSEQYWFIARLAACWALLPVAALYVVVLVHPNLLMVRYVLFVVPAWAILAGLGVVTLAELSRAAIVRLPRSGSVLATAVASVVTVVLITGAAVDQASTHREIRTSGGHGEDIRPGLELATQSEYSELPIVISAINGSVLVGAYARREEDRLVLQRFQRTESTIWPSEQSSAASKRFLRGRKRVILLQRRSGSKARCKQVPPVMAIEINYCMPHLLKAMGYRVELMETGGRGWVVAVLKLRRQRKG